MTRPPCFPKISSTDSASSRCFSSAQYSSICVAQRVRRRKSKRKSRAFSSVTFSMLSLQRLPNGSAVPSKVRSQSAFTHRPSPNLASLQVVAMSALQVSERTALNRMSSASSTFFLKKASRHRVVNSCRCCQRHFFFLPSPGSILAHSVIRWRSAAHAAVKFVSNRMSLASHICALDKALRQLGLTLNFFALRQAVRAPLTFPGQCLAASLPHADSKPADGST
mmetsp:Transcript_12460/g.34316  ORF Transcript_12460/g.34316 Transcript_12460/m.34316 type:complete len:223 (+) Transcript_12460:2588-3256(+)